MGRIPQGFRAVTPHLVVRDAGKAIDFYIRAFGAVERFRMPGPDGHVMHAEVTIGDSIVMLCDEHPEHGSLGPQAGKPSPVTLHLYVEDADAAFRRAVAAGAEVRMPLADMFWGDRYGQVADPFGHSWSIATNVREVSPEEIERAQRGLAGK